MEVRAVRGLLRLAVGVMRHGHRYLCQHRDASRWLLGDLQGRAIHALERLRPRDHPDSPTGTSGSRDDAPVHGALVDPYLIQIEKEWRSERLLNEFGLTEQVAEPIYRERMPADDKEGAFNRIEYEGLMVIAQMFRERDG